MAQSTALLTYDQAGNREDLMDIVTNISPTDTYLFTNLSRDKASARYVEWMTDSLASAADNAQIEGVDYSFAKVSTRTRTGGYTQIFDKLIEISGTQEAVDKAGVQSELEYQLQKKMKEVARDIENALVTGTGNSGASGTARRLKGILAWISTNNETGSGTGTQALTETLYNSLLQTVFTAGGNPDLTLANAFQKRQIDAFAGNTNARRTDDLTEKRIINTVSIYESAFGVQRIVLHRWMDTDKVAVLQKDLWKVSVLRPVAMEEVAKIGDAMRWVVQGELTLKALNEAGSGKITELTTS